MKNLVFEDVVGMIKIETFICDIGIWKDSRLVKDR